MTVSVIVRKCSLVSALQSMIVF